MLARLALRRTRTLIPAVGARLAPAPQQEVSDVLLAAEVDDALGGGGGALEDAAHAFGDPGGLDADEVVPEVDGAALGVVGDEHDAAGGGEADGVRGERGEERLEGFHY